MSLFGGDGNHSILFSWLSFQPVFDQVGFREHSFQPSSHPCLVLSCLGGSRLALYLLFLHKKVAIKKIPSAFDDVVDAKRIVREVRLLRRLDHMNIIKIVDILPPPSLADFNDVYIVSELMDTDLHRVIYSSQVSDTHRYVLDRFG